MPKEEPRAIEQLEERCAIEKELADRLWKASREKGRGMYGPTYDEMFRRVPLLGLRVVAWKQPRGQPGSGPDLPPSF
jgi:hypothetical protein